MKEETSIIDIFQDPLLTLVALILLGTLWIVIPSEDSASPDGPSPDDIQREMDQLQAAIAMLDEEISEIAKEVRRLEDEIQVLESLASNAEEVEEKATQLHRDIAILQETMKRKQEEKVKLERELAEAKERAEVAEGVQELERSIAELVNLKAEVEAKEALLERLRRELEKAKKAQAQKETDANEQARLLEELRQSINAERELIEKLEEEKAEIAEGIAKRGGMGEYTTDAVEGKKQEAFEAVNNRLFLIDRKNYDTEAFLTMRDGKVVAAAKLTRKESVSGTSIDTIVDPGSEFQAQIRELNATEAYLFFGVQKDSFEVFLKARQIAWEKGFAVGWQPWEAGPIYVSAGGGGQVDARSH